MSTHTYIPAHILHIRHTQAHIRCLHFTLETNTHIKPTPSPLTSDIHTHISHAFTSHIRHTHTYRTPSHRTSDIHTYIPRFQLTHPTFNTYTPRFNLSHQTYTHMYPTPSLHTSDIQTHISHVFTSHNRRTQTYTYPKLSH
jgi:hypothetical protein